MKTIFGLIKQYADTELLHLYLRHIYIYVLRRCFDTN